MRDYEALDQDEKTINVHVSHLREKIEDDPSLPAVRPDGPRRRVRVRGALTLADVRAPATAVPPAASAAARRTGRRSPVPQSFQGAPDVRVHGGRGAHPDAGRPGRSS